MPFIHEPHRPRTSEHPHPWPHPKRRPKHHPKHHPKRRRLRLRHPHGRLTHTWERGAAPANAALLVLLVLLVAIAGCGDARATPEGGALLRWDGDVLGGGSTVEVSDSIAGDAMLAGGSLTFSGTAGGAVLSAGREHEIDGTVGSSVRAAGAVVRLRARVGQNVTLAGGEVYVEEEAVVGRNAYLAGGRIEVRGSTGGSLRAAGGEVLLDGPVTGDVRVEANQLVVGPEARIGGDLLYDLDEGSPAIDPGAEVGGQIAALQDPGGDRGGDGGGAFFRVLRMLAFIVAGIAFVALFPTPAATTSDAVRERTLASFGLGFLLLLLVPITIGILAVTIVGIPLAIIGAVLFAIALYLGPVPVAVWLGEGLVADRVSWNRAPEVIPFLAGGAVLMILGFVPAIGILVRVIATVLGLGTVAVVVFGGSPGTTAPPRTGTPRRG